MTTNIFSTFSRRNRKPDRCKARQQFKPTLEALQGLLLPGSILSTGLDGFTLAPALGGSFDEAADPGPERGLASDFSGIPTPDDRRTNEAPQGDLNTQGQAADPAAHATGPAEVRRADFSHGGDQWSPNNGGEVTSHGGTVAIPTEPMTPGSGQSRYITVLAKKGEWCTVVNGWGYSATVYFWEPARSEIKIRYGGDWFFTGFNSQQQTLDGIHAKHVSVSRYLSLIGARVQIKVPFTTYVTCWYVPT
jgi:hypothetical protein